MCVILQIHLWYSYISIHLFITINSVGKLTEFILVINVDIGDPVPSTQIYHPPRFLVVYTLGVHAVLGIVSGKVKS